MTEKTTRAQAYDELGLPIVPLSETARSLLHCVQAGFREDAAGHVQELIAEFRPELEARAAYQEKLAGFAGVRSERDLLRKELAERSWILTKDRLPDRVPNRKYSQVTCLVWYKDDVQILVYNHEHKCWDDETGDDYVCDPLDVEAWMLLPGAPPKKDA